MSTDLLPDVPVPLDATEMSDWTQHGPDLARLVFYKQSVCEFSAA